MCHLFFFHRNDQTTWLASTPFCLSQHTDKFILSKKNTKKISTKAKYAVTKSYVSRFESERRCSLSVTGRTAVWGWTAVKSSSLQVIFRAREALGRAEMLLICNSGAIHTDQYADLSQTDCMMFCFAPSTSTHQRSINHQALLFCFSRKGLVPVLFLGFALLFYLRTFIALCSLPLSISVCSHTHIHTHPHKHIEKDKNV